MIPTGFLSKEISLIGVFHEVSELRELVGADRKVFGYRFHQGCEIRDRIWARSFGGIDHLAEKNVHHAYPRLGKECGMRKTARDVAISNPGFHARLGLVELKV